MSFVNYSISIPAATRKCQTTYLEFTIESDIYILQEGEIQLLSYDILFSFLEVHKATVVCLLQRPEKISTDIIVIVFRGTNCDLLPVFLDAISPVVFALLVLRPG